MQNVQVAVAYWLRNYAKNRKVAGSRLDEVKPLTEMSARSRKIMFLGSRARPVRRADNL
jgi:hypothetical protein